MNQEYILKLSRSQYSYISNLLTTEHEKLEQDMNWEYTDEHEKQIIQTMIEDCQSVITALHKAREQTK